MALSDFESTMQWKIDITQFTKGMQEAKAVLKAANNEFDLTSSTMEKWSDNIDGLAAKIKQLGDKMEVEARIVELYKQAWEEAKKEFGETSPEAERIAELIQKHTINFNKAEVQLGKYTNKLSDLNGTQDTSITEFGKLNAKISEQEEKLASLKNEYKDAVVQFGKNSTEAKTLAGQIKTLSSELKNNKDRMAEVDKSADNLDRTMDTLNDGVKTVSDGFTVFKGALANLVAQGINKVIQGVKTLASETYNAGASFEASMSRVEAISGATADELDTLTEKAKYMGETTKFTASEAAEAFNYMAMAGWKTTDMLNGIEGVMNLAAASGSDLATASSIVTDALTAMGYEAKDATRLADVMAAAASNANTTIELMGHTFQYAAPLVGAMGYSMEDTAIAIGLMANAGVKGEKAGTALRAILTRLAAPPKATADAMDRLGISLTDSKGNMKDFSVIINELRDKFSKLSETEQAAEAKHLAGQEALSGFLAIVRSSDEDLDKLTKAIENSSGAAEDMANTMLDNVAGQITLLKSKVEGVMIKIFERMSGSIRKAINTISDALMDVDWDSFAESAGKAAEKVADLFAYVLKNGDNIVSILKTIAIAFITYKAVATITTVITAFKNLFNAVKDGQSIMAAFTSTLKLNPYALAAAGIAALVGGLVELAKKQQKAMEAEYGLSKAQQESIDKVVALTDKYNDLNKARNEQVRDISAEFGYLKELKDEYNSLIDSNGKIKEGYENRASFIKKQLAEAMGIEADDLQKLIDKNGQLGEAIDKVIEKKKAEAILSANEEIYREAIKERSNALNDLSEAQKTLDEVEQRYIDTQDKAQKVWDKYNEMVGKSPEAAYRYINANMDVIQSNEIAKRSYDDAKQKVEDAQGAWIDYNVTIQNYEGLAAAIISGDTDKINEAMQNMQNHFITAETGNRESLERQVQNYKDNLANLEKAIEDGTPNVTEEMVAQARSMVDAAKAELDKLPPEASEAGEEAGNNFATSMGAKKDLSLRKGKELADNAEIGINPAISKLLKAGATAGTNFGDAVGSTTNKTNAKTKGEELADKAVEGAESENGEEGGAKASGSHFGEGFFNGIGSWLTSVWERGKELAKQALAGLRKGQEEGSPSKLTRQSGVFFGEGYALGIESMLNPVRAAASDMAKQAVNALGSNLNNQMKLIGVDGGQSLIDGINSVVPNISSSVANLKQSVASANSMLNNAHPINVGSFGQEGANSQTVVFNQTINSPKAVDRLTLYRETNSLLFSAKVRLNNV